MMLCSGLSSTLLLAATCLLVASGLTRADLSANAISTGRVITCDNLSVQRLSCESGVIIVQSAVYRCADKKNCSQRDTLDIIKQSCDGKKVCEVEMNMFGTPDPSISKYLDTTFACFPAIHTVTCEGSQANLQCDEGEVIAVYWAEYGRRDKTTCSAGCPDSQLQNVSCSSPTTKVADSCNGKNSCTIEASNSVFGEPCAGTYKYLEVAYECQFHTVACEGSQANLQCEKGQVILILWANYGRRDTTTCSYQRPDGEIQNVHCSNPTTKVADSCNGKNSCTIEASNSVFGEPCAGTYKYLEVAYECQFHSITCEYSYVNLQCGKGQVIVVHWADYGRRDKTTCSHKRPPSQLQNIYCSSPTTKVADSCNGKNSCSMKVRNSVFGDPCVGTYKYLEVVYDCQYVLEGENP